MIFGILLALFMAATLVGVPLVFAMLLSAAFLVVVLERGYPMEAVFLAFMGGVEPFHLVSIPLFVVAGELIGRGGVGARIIAFARTLVGFMPGGLGIVTVSSSMVFAGISGSAVADSAAVGSVMIPGMHRQGYSKEFAAALVAAAGTIGIIIPPSIPMIVFAFVGNVSIAELFLAGFVPGLLFGLGMIVICMWTGRRRGWDMGGARASRAELWRAFVDCVPALLMPVIILGGIFSGIFTPTEAAAVAVAYGLLVSMAVYRDVRLRDLPQMVLDSFITSATVMLVIGSTTALAWVITLEGVPQMMVEAIRALTDDKYVFLLLVNVFLLLLGIFLEPIPALILTVPLLLPMAKAFAVDPVHFGLIVVCNLAIGLYTPPVGGTLFVAAKIANVGIGGITRELGPIFGVSLIVLMLVTFLPGLSLGLVWLFR